ncbi:MAG: DUF2163 domain-containing protein [Pseudomonadota bacterium]|nr:DUF2163 domain-containing protein [Pseudomonadota bacterium]
MSLADVRLSLLAFPQRWNGGSLEARVLLLPAGDPLAAVDGLPPFSGTDWMLRAVVLPGVDALLGPPGATPNTFERAFTAAAPANASALFPKLRDEFNVKAPPSRAKRRVTLGATAIRKQLPDSYTESFPFERPSGGTSITDEFGCALREVAGGQAKDPKPPIDTTWGAVLSFALRQPLLARALGLLHDVTIPVPATTPLDAGGWVYFELDPAGGVNPLNADTVRAYAARLPALARIATRRVFGAVLLPVGHTSAGEYDEALAEAAMYDDGFGKIVHAAQAKTADAATASHDALKPATDAGIDLGWDDEQVTAWLNRQIEGLKKRLGDPTGVEAPLGVGGYRIDVRMPDVAALARWQSLCRAFSADVNGAPAPLTFPATAPVLFSEAFDDELTVEPTPVRTLNATSDAAWLPRHFARWQDGSLVVSDTTLFRLSGTSPNDANGNKLVVPPSLYGARDASIHLRYGNRYEFRCRFADLTGGGPKIADAPQNAAQHPIATARFLRYVQPKSARVATDIPLPKPGKPTPPVSTVNTLDVWRPLIGYPEAKFAGIDDPAVIEQLVKNGPAAKKASDAVGVNDPDVTHLRVSVQVRIPAHDPGADDGGGFRELYHTDLAFPPFDPDAVFDPGAPLAITLDYVDQPDVETLAPPAPGATNLPVPRARDVRLRLTPICADKPHYFGDAWVREGLTANIATRADGDAEDDLFLPRPKERAANAILLQPAPDFAQRLAAHLDLAIDGLSFKARPGERVVFGASAALRHTLSGDASEITFAAEGELLGHWVAVVQTDLARDWTWDGCEDRSFEIRRSDAAAPAPAAFGTIGEIRLPFVVSQPAAQGNADVGTEARTRTRLVFFDAVDPNPGDGKFPEILTPTWRLEPRLRGGAAANGAAQAQKMSLRLPVAVSPRQTPKLVSAGIALSDYVHDDGYRSTAPRRRVLWFEFDEPVADPNDALFARVLAYGPDPLLSGAITHLLLPVPDVPIGATSWLQIIESLLPTPPKPPDLAIDPEPMRVIVPDQPEDSSGLDAMIAMRAANPPAGETKARHFIVPLPPGIDSDMPELFGFWTYELRIGHHAIWSTAQARFGRPLVVKGVQHPAPVLSVAAMRVRPSPKDPASSPPRIVVVAPHATAVFEHRRLTQPAAGDPRTRIWVLLYAQVTQADRATRRNVLVARAPAIARVTQAVPGIPPSPPSARDVIGVAHFDEQVINARLAEMALPADAPLSVVAVELLPGDHLSMLKVPLGDREIFYLVDTPEIPAGTLDARGAAAFASVNIATSDPLGAELGSIASRRILRCSPLTPVAPAC